MMQMINYNEAVVMVEVVMCSVTIICNPKIAADYPNRQHQVLSSKSEAQSPEHRVEKHVLPLAACQEKMHQQYYVGEEHKNPLVVRDGTQQCEAFPIRQ